MTLVGMSLLGVGFLVCAQVCAFDREAETRFWIGFAIAAVGGVLMLIGGPL